MCFDCKEVDDREIRVNKQRELEKIQMLGDKGYRDFKFETLIENAENRDAIKICKDFDPVKENLYIYGNSGSGKTHIAYAVARICLDFGIKTGVWTQVSLTRHLRKKSLSSVDLEDLEIERISKLDVLVIDDLGVGRSSEYSNTILYEIINNRIMGLKNGLIITSNLSISEIAQKMDDARFADRVAGLCKIIRLQSEISWRTKNKEFIGKIFND